MIASGQLGGSKELQRAALRAGGSTDKNLQTGFAAITQMCDAIHLGTQQREFAKQLYKRVEDEKLLRGKPQEAVQAACIFIACRSGNVGRSLKEIAALCSENVKKNKIGQCFQIIEKHLQTTSLPSLTSASRTTTDSSGTGSNTRNNPEELLVRYCSYLGDQKLEFYAREICHKVRERGTLDGRSPISVASSCIYFAAHLMNRVKGKNLREVSRVTQVTEGTIKICYR
jgi:transcription initiation factor TFIIB